MKVLGQLQVNVLCSLINGGPLITNKEVKKWLLSCFKSFDSKQESHIKLVVLNCTDTSI